MSDTHTLKWDWDKEYFVATGTGQVLGEIYGFINWSVKARFTLYCNNATLLVVETCWHALTMLRFYYALGWLRDDGTCQDN